MSEVDLWTNGNLQQDPVALVRCSGQKIWPSLDPAFINCQHVFNQKKSVEKWEFTTRPSAVALVRCLRNIWSSPESCHYQQSKESYNGMSELDMRTIGSL